MPAAATSSQRTGIERNPRQACGRNKSSSVSETAYTRAVAHSGCSPRACNSRKGHHETPQTNALSTSASAGRTPGRELAMHVVVAGDFQQVVHFLTILRRVAPVPAH